MEQILLSSLKIMPCKEKKKTCPNTVNLSFLACVIAVETRAVNNDGCPSNTFRLHASFISLLLLLLLPVHGTMPIMRLKDASSTVEIGSMFSTTYLRGKIQNL